MSWVTALAAIGTSLCWWAERPIGQGLTVFGRDPSAPTEVPWGAVVLATAVGGLGAVVLVRVANRTTRPVRTFAAAVTVGFALTCVPPVQAAATTGTLAGLLLMHLIAAAVIVPPAARLLREPAPAGSSQRRPRPKSSGNLGWEPYRLCPVTSPGSWPPVPPRSPRSRYPCCCRLDSTSTSGRPV